MTKKKKIVLNDYHKHDRWFTIAKVLLVLAPFVALGYLQAFTNGGELSVLLQQNPEITVTFLISMAGPFTAYLLGFAQKHLYEGDAAYMMAHLTLLLGAEFFFAQYGLYPAYGISDFLVYRMTDMSPLASLRLKWKDHFFRDLSGCIVLIVFSAFCLFVSLRLGM